MVNGKLNLMILVRCKMYTVSLGMFVQDFFILRVLCMMQGIIPRNEFGNVYMFTPDMVPRGAVHIKRMRVYHSYFYYQA